MTTTRRSFIEKIAGFTGALGLTGWPLFSAKKSKRSDMLVHQVYFWLKEPENADAHHKLKKGLEKMLSITSIKSGHVGVPAGTEARDVVDHSFSFSYMASFENLEDHNAYQKDPIHLEFIKDCAGLWERVQVYDYNLI